MIRIISDTSTLYSSAEARAAGFAVAPLSVTIAGKSYREFDEISSDEFVAIIDQGHMPPPPSPPSARFPPFMRSSPGSRS